MQKTFTIKTYQRECLVDITREIENIVNKSSTENGIVNVYAHGATAAIMIQENWDESVQKDMVRLMRRLVPRGIWTHDSQDGNGDSHLKAGIIGPSETIPLQNGRLGLSTWQNIFFCEFDGPREARHILITIIPSPEH